MQRRHRKLIFERPESGVPAYASLYRFGNGDGPAPLLVYIGGTNSKARYLARLHSEPVQIASELEKALALRPLPRLDALICPCPVESREEGLDYFIGHFDDELLPALGGSPPSLGCVGYSAGALPAGYLAIVADARAVATFGGTGLVHAARAGADILQEWQRASHPEVEVGIFRNAGDQVADALSVAGALRRPLIARAMGERAGGHGFQDYAVNGTVRDAFRFLLERLR